jgi:hypothetical protein
VGALQLEDFKFSSQRQKELRAYLIRRIQERWGRYPVILYLKCYHDIPFKISKCKWQKNLEQNCRCLQDMSLQSLEFSEPNSKYTKRNKKEKSNMNSVPKRQNVKMILFT